MTLARNTPMKRTAMKVKRRDVGGDFDLAARQQIVARSRGNCEFPDCQVRGSQVHHRLRRSQGGKGAPDNGMHVCDFHHGFIHANPAISYAQGWLIRSGT